MKENFPNLVKEIVIQGLEAQRVPNKLDPKRTTPRHIIIKMPNVKDKERILKEAREKQRVTYKWVPIRLSADFSKDTLLARRDWEEVFMVSFFKDFIYLFLERGREGEREVEKCQCMVPSHTPPTRDLTCNSGMCPDWELNPWPFGIQAGAQSTEPHHPGQEVFKVMKKEGPTT